LTQRTPELVELFRDGEEMVSFDSRAELRKQVELWLARPQSAREAIAQAGYRRVEHDTYARRAETIMARAISGQR